LSNLTPATQVTTMGQMHCSPEDASLRSDLVLIRSFVVYKGRPPDHATRFDISMLVSHINVGGVMHAATGGKTFPTLKVKLCFGESMGKNCHRGILSLLNLTI